MKKILLLAGACLLLTGNSFAQTAGGGGNSRKNADEARSELKTTKIHMGTSKDKQVRLVMHNSTVEIVGHNGDDVIIEGRGINSAPARAEGLKPLYNTLEDNTGLGISAVKENNTLTLTKASRNSGKYTIRVPKNASVQYKEANWTGGNLTISDIDGEIEVKMNNASATLNNVTGPIVANSVNGAFDIKFSSLNQSKPNAISTINGGIDITLPANTKANFKLKSMMGEIYTDFDMNLKKDGKNDLTLIGGGNNIDGKTNGGGVEMSIQTINSEIFIRKKK